MGSAGKRLAITKRLRFFFKKNKPVRIGGHGSSTPLGLVTEAGCTNVRGLHPRLLLAVSALQAWGSRVGNIVHIYLYTKSEPGCRFPIAFSYPESDDSELMGLKPCWVSLRFPKNLGSIIFILIESQLQQIQLTWIRPGFGAGSVPVLGEGFPFQKVSAFIGRSTQV